ncbi:hypothetical protein [Pseudoalteromonas denitrificans]|jgi:hypothetical protein|uniref:Uncharacterized protein n=1 Tax=Pseudoalteromonas denitrificans DSM 6059 TaxID=1123010 RepID=A0A1I1ESH6_9GAMM|nr:hypothetical protein [Pseudoalteromonas denitrificans]SFB90064.1 hypothetical protein SAMN02745724_00421 [Pseudoalteromonas denitrificans DSM 6059]
MTLNLNKKKLKNLSKDNKTLPQDMTAQIGGAQRPNFSLNGEVFCSPTKYCISNNGC